jgi:hypothetical protein
MKVKKDQRKSENTLYLAKQLESFRFRFESRTTQARTSDGNNLGFAQDSAHSHTVRITRKVRGQTMRRPTQTG